MAEADKRKAGGGKLARSETVTVRLDPKLRYMAELAARKQRRTLSSFIEWSIEDTLNRFPIKEGPDWMTALMAEAEQLWDVDEPDRLAKLALRYPELLTHEEQIVWKMIKECGLVWRGRYKDEWTWTVDEKSLAFDRLREHWETFLAIARGELPASELPCWAKKKPKNGQSGPEDPDDIPF